MGRKDKLAQKRDEQMTRPGHLEPRIWTVAAGKGGVGKTFVASSLAITLSRMGFGVTLIDLDLSGGNLHTCLGLTPFDRNLRHFFEDANTRLETMSCPTTIPKLKLIQGLWESWKPFELTTEHVARIAEQVKTLKTDIVIFDLGSTLTIPVLSLFNMSDEKILVTTPEPTSIERSYRFLESLIVHNLRTRVGTMDETQFLGDVRNHRNVERAMPFSMKNHILSNLGISEEELELLNQSPIRLVMNCARSHSDHELGLSIKSVCCKFYDFPMDYAGCIDFDNAVWQSIRKKQPTLVEFPFTPLVGQFLSVCKHLVHPQSLRAVV